MRIMFLKICMGKYMRLLMSYVLLYHAVFWKCTFITIYNHEAFWKKVFEFHLFLLTAFILSSFGLSFRKLTCFIQGCILFHRVGSVGRLALPLWWDHVWCPHHRCLGLQALLYMSARIHQPTCGKNFHMPKALEHVYSMFKLREIIFQNWSLVEKTTSFLVFAAPPVARSCLAVGE